MHAGSFRLLRGAGFDSKTATEIESRVRGAFRLCAVPEQSGSLRHPHSRAGGELDIGSHAGARPELKCAFVSHAASDVMKRLAHTRGVCIERALSRT